MKLFTFCVDIGHHSRTNLEYVLKNILLKSLSNHVKDFELHVFTNFKLEINNDKVKVNKYFDLGEQYYENKWLNLSYNKINIWKHLYDKTGENFTWVDLDTVISYDISYFNDVDNLFIENGGSSIGKWPLSHNTNYAVTFNRYIQGNIWKLNINLYNDIMKTFKKSIELGLKFKFDLQDIYNYYCYFDIDDKNPRNMFNMRGILKKQNINILGYTYKPHVMSGLAVWDRSGMKHPTKQGLEQIFIDKNKTPSILRTRLYPNKEIHILSFTFRTLNTMLNNPTLLTILNKVA